MAAWRRATTGLFTARRRQCDRQPGCGGWTGGGALSYAATISGNIGLDPGPHHFVVSTGLAYNPAANLTVSANISQTSTAAKVIKDSVGVMALTGTNSYTGSTIVSNGTLEVYGSQPQSSVQVFAGTLQGNGTVGPLESSGASSTVAATEIRRSYIAATSMDQRFRRVRSAPSSMAPSRAVVTASFKPAAR